MVLFFSANQIRPIYSKYRQTQDHMGKDKPNKSVLTLQQYGLKTNWQIILAQRDNSIHSGVFNWKLRAGGSSYRFIGSSEIKSIIKEILAIYIMKEEKMNSKEEKKSGEKKTLTEKLLGGPRGPSSRNSCMTHSDFLPLGALPW